MYWNATFFVMLLSPWVETYKQVMFRTELWHVESLVGCDMLENNEFNLLEISIGRGVLGSNVFDYVEMQKERDELGNNLLD